MPGRTRTQLRQLVARQFPLPFVSGTSGTSTTSTLVDATDLPNLGQFSNDSLIGQWIYVSGGSPSTRDLRITDSVQSTGTLPFIPALAAAPSTLAYEILPASATAIHQAIDEALLALYDRGIIVRPILDRSLVSGSPIYNAGFAHWIDAVPFDAYTSAAGSATHGPIGWTLADATVLKEANDNRVAGSENAMRMTRTTGGTPGSATLNFEWCRFLHDFRGNSITLYGWVFCATASVARISLVEHNSAGTAATTFSSYHSGSGRYERLSVTLATSSTATALRVACNVVDNAASASFADLWVDGGETVFEYPIVIANMPEGPDEIWTLGSGNATEQRQLGTKIPVSQWRFYKHYNEQQSSDVGTLWLPCSVPAGKRLLVKASGPLTLPTADTHNIEITQFESLLVAKMAALKIIEGRLVGATGTAMRNLSTLGARLSREVEELSGGLGGQIGAAALSPDWTT